MTSKSTTPPAGDTVTSAYLDSPTTERVNAVSFPSTSSILGFRREEKKSLLAFLPVKGWIMVTFFMCLGITLKHVPGVPTAFFASFYCGLGPALIVAGATFLASWLKEGER